ncbi:hypothetical protein MJ923_14750 [Shewanella sp. 3B26]|uniref:Uncharacterized protein n=1 Tax=Shewanella zhuhaiensis TaxID=2919576 RepID=A0AAJ1FC32_9GAMM|nr:hypothetical protein [Shewanella zhuhaiensis]MCH4295565.1 hypothetical protein [Shewanella zhuhaiensis]
MAALPVIEYRWDDPGAPQLVNRTAAEWIDVFKKCLVDGYGTKPGAGWSVAFENEASKQVMFQTAMNIPGHTGGFWKLWPKDGQETQNNATMLNRSGVLVTGLDPNWDTVPNASYQNAFYGYYVNKWIILATPISFYIFTGSDNRPYMFNATVEHPCFGVGALDSAYPNDASEHTLMVASLSSNEASGHWSRCLGYISSGVNAVPLAETSGTQSKQWYRHRLPFDSFGASSSTNTPGTGCPNPVYGRHLLYSAVAAYNSGTDSEGTLIKDSLLAPLFRGGFPGLRQMSTSGFSDQLWPQTRVINGQKHYLLSNPNSGGCNLWVNAEEWYE